MQQEEDIVDGSMNIINPSENSPEDSDSSDLKKVRCQDFAVERNSVLSRVSGLFLNPFLSDVSFTFNDSDTQFSAHKLILATASKVFEIMFFGSFVEAKSDKLQVKVDDIETPIFKEVLRFIYTDTVYLGPSNFQQILYSSKKYMLEHLEFVCVGTIIANLEPKNVFSLLKLAIVFEIKDLREKCLTTIDENGPKVFAGAEFSDVPLDILANIVRRQSLSSVTEFELYNFVLEWAVNRCKLYGLDEKSPSHLKLVLGDPITFETYDNPENLHTDLKIELEHHHRNKLSYVLESIRYTLMPVKFFSKGPAVSGLLNPNLVKDVFIFLIDEADSKEPIRSDLNSLNLLNLKNRDYPLTVGYSASSDAFSNNYFDKDTGSYQAQEVGRRFRNIKEGWSYTGSRDQIRFRVNTSIVILGIGVYGAIRVGGAVTVTLELYDHSDCRKLITDRWKLVKTRAEDTIQHIFFQTRTLELKQDRFYIISLYIEGDDTYFGTGGLSEISIGDYTNHWGKTVRFTFEHADGSDNGTTVQEGQIPDIIFALKNDDNYRLY